MIWQCIQNNKHHPTNYLEKNVTRFAAQGNRRFTSHRDYFEFAWNFWIPNGTETLSSRAGILIEIEERFEGIGLKSNFIKIRHSDGTIAINARISQ